MLPIVWSWRQNNTMENVKLAFGERWCFAAFPVDLFSFVIVMHNVTLHCQCLLFFLPFPYPAWKESWSHPREAEVRIWEQEEGRQGAYHSWHEGAQEECPQWIMQGWEDGNKMDWSLQVSVQDHCHIKAATSKTRNYLWCHSCWQLWGGGSVLPKTTSLAFMEELMFDGLLMKTDSDPHFMSGSL